MANLTNINGYFNVSTVGTVNVPSGSFYVTKTSGDAIAGIISSGGSGKPYYLRSNTNGSFAIYDDTACLERLTISSGGDATFAGNLTANVGSFNSPDASESILMNLVANNGNNAATFRTTASGHIFEIRSQNSGTIKIDSSTTTFAGNVIVNLASAVAGAIAAFDSNGNTIWLTGRSSDGESSVSFRNNADSAYNGRIAATDTLMSFSQASVYTFDGNVGIGTTSLTNKLEVLGTSGSTNVARFKAQGATTDCIVNLESSRDCYLQFTAASTVKWALAADYPNTGDFDLYNYPNNFNSMTWKDDGKVGIGTTSPDRPLHVSSADNQLARFESTDAYGGIEICDNTSGTAKPLISALGNDFIFYNGGSSNTEAMRIASGKVFIGKTVESFSTAGWSFAADGSNVFADGVAAISMNRGGADGNIIQFFKSDTLVGKIICNAASVTYSTTSDYRLKEDLKDFAGLDMVSKIPVYDFKWKTNEIRSYGVVAHELQEILPEAVSGIKDEEEMQGVDYGRITPILIKAIQELKAEIETLKTQINK